MKTRYVYVKLQEGKIPTEITLKEVKKILLERYGGFSEMADIMLNFIKTDVKRSGAFIPEFRIFERFGIAVSQDY